MLPLGGPGAQRLRAVLRGGDAGLGAARPRPRRGTQGAPQRWDVDVGGGPSAFSPTDFKAQVEAFVHYLKATPPAEGFAEVLYPGEIEYRTEQRRRREGIPIEDATWARLGEIATRFGIAPLRSPS